MKKLFIFMLLLLLVLIVFPSSAKQDDDDDTICPVESSTWQAAPTAWPVESLMLGSQFYSQEELLAILEAPANDDASLILAKQLIAAKLNIASGVDPTVISNILIEGDGLMAGYAGKLPFNVARASDDGGEMILISGTFEVFNQGTFSAECDDESDDPESTPEPEMTPEPEITPIVIDDDGNLPPIIVIEGPVQNVNINIITIYDIDIVVPENTPGLTVIQIGDIIRVEGELLDDDDDDDDGGSVIVIDNSVNITIVLVQVNIIFINIDVHFGPDGVIWRDPGDCNNAPPAWAPAHGWRARCEGRGGPGGGDDDDDDD